MWFFLRNLEIWYEHLSKNYNFAGIFTSSGVHHTQEASPRPNYSNFQGILITRCLGNTEYLLGIDCNISHLIGLCPVSEGWLHWLHSSCFMQTSWVTILIFQFTSQLSRIAIAMFSSGTVKLIVTAVWNEQFLIHLRFYCYFNLF